MSGARMQRAAPARPPLLLPYIGLVLALAGGAAFGLARADVQPLIDAPWPALPVLAALLVAAEYLFVRFRYGGEINAFNLVEAVLAPLLFAFPPEVVVAVMAVTQAADGVLRRNAPVKAAFNIGQWSLATAAGAAVFHATATSTAIGTGTIGPLLLALGVVGLVNQLAFTFVLTIANRQSLRTVLTRLSHSWIPGWAAGWAINSIFGLLFVFAFVAHPASVALFIVPLVVLHLAYRGYAGARSDRARLAGLHSAAQVLADPLDPTTAIAPFLEQVAESFEARGAMLVLRAPGGRVVYRWNKTARRVAEEHQAAGDTTLESMLLSTDGPQRVTPAVASPVTALLLEAGWRDCLVAPLLDGGRALGVLVVLDQTGLEGFEAGELAVIEALARETASTLAKGRLLQAILEERRRLEEIVTTTSDGIFTIGVDGAVRSWNPAMERITGLRAESILGKAASLEVLRPRAASGDPLTLAAWASARALPRDVTITTVTGELKRLECSYSFARTDGRARTLVVVARDVTTETEFEVLRREYGRLAEAEAAQRAVVEQLQEAVMPAKPQVSRTQLGVFYEASDPATPTGGDLYDWQPLPSGEVHIAVVDVLGHGVGATKDALTVIHALRLLAIEGCPMEEMIARADTLVSAQNADLVATVAVARYDPESGRARMVGGGHPPALHVSADGSVHQIPAPGGAIGWPGAGSVGVSEVRLAPGDALVLYTDGVIEARKDILEGEETLMRHARELCDSSADDLARELVQRSLAGGNRRDDSLTLVIRRAPVQERMRRAMPKDAGAASDARHALMGWLRARDVPEDTLERATMVAAELLSNAVRAARSKLTLSAVLDNGELTVEVSDDGRGRPDLDALGFDPPDHSARTGRGLFIVRALAPDVSILSTDAGTVIRARIRSMTGSGEAVRLATSAVEQREGPTPRALT